MIRPSEHKHGANTGAGNLVKLWLDNNKFTTARGIAREMCRLYPDKFHSMEQSRRVVRGIIGSNGKDKRILAENKYAKEAITLPEPIKETFFEPYVITEESALILNDAHFPFQENGAIETAVKEGKKWDVKHIILNGDWWDCMEFSRFTINSLHRSLKHEYSCTKMSFQWLRKQFPKTPITWKLGNHEGRYIQRLHEKSTAMMQVWALEHGQPDTDEDMGNPSGMTHFFGLKELGIKVVEQKKPIEFDKLVILHGDELGGGEGIVNPARSLYMKFKDVSACGHSHRPSSNTVKTGKDFIINTWSMGCLCQLRPFYRPINDWILGFAIVERHDRKGFDFHNKKILKNGEVYEA